MTRQTPPSKGSTLSKDETPLSAHDVSDLDLYYLAERSATHYRRFLNKIIDKEIREHFGIGQVSLSVLNTFLQNDGILDASNRDNYIEPEAEWVEPLISSLVNKGFLVEIRQTPLAFKLTQHGIDACDYATARLKEISKSDELSPGSHLTDGELTDMLRAMIRLERRAADLSRVI